jgi:purine-cytosine permease-like protein
MDPKNLNAGWTALVSLVVGFGAMVPFMNTGLLVGPVATWLDGADLSFYVGFSVAFCMYLALRGHEAPNAMLTERLRNRSAKGGSAV